MVRCRICQIPQSGTFAVTAHTESGAESQNSCRLNVSSYLLGHEDTGLIYSYCQKCWTQQLFKTAVVSQHLKQLNEAKQISDETNEQLRTYNSKLQIEMNQKSKEIFEAKSQNESLIKKISELTEQIKALKAKATLEANEFGPFPHKVLEPDSMLDMSVPSGYQTPRNPQNTALPVPPSSAIGQILEERNKEIARLVQQFQSTETELSRRTIDLTQAKTECSSLKTELNKVSEAARRAQDELERAKHEIQSQRSIAINEANLRVEVGKLREELTRSRAMAEQTLVQEVKKAQENLKNEFLMKLNTSTENYNKLVISYQQLNGEKTAMSSQLSRMQDEAQKQASSLDMSEKLRKDTEVKCSQLNSQIAVLSSQLQEAHKQVQAEAAKRDAALQQLQSLKKTMDSEKHFIGIGIDFTDYERLRAHITTWSKELQGYQLDPELDRAHTQIKKSLEHTMQAVRIEAEKYTESLLTKEIADKKQRLSQNTEAIMKMEAVLTHLSPEDKALSLKPLRDQVEQLTKRLEVLEKLRSGLKTVTGFK